MSNVDWIKEAIKWAENSLTDTRQKMHEDAKRCIPLSVHNRFPRYKICKVVITALREKLDREEKTPLTCDGCSRDYVRRLHPLAVNDMCQRCIRLPQRSDRYQAKEVDEE